MYDVKISDAAELKKIWKDIFKDTDEYISLYFREKFLPEKTYVIRDRNKIASMLYYSDVKLTDGKKIYNSAYICGIATLPEYRGKNYASTLVSACLKDLNLKGYDLAFLIPANSSLFDFYKKHGFEVFSYLKTIDVKIDDTDSEYIFSEKKNVKNMYNDFSGLKVMRSDNDFDILNKCYGHPFVFDDGYIYAFKESSTLYVVEHSYKKLSELNDKLKFIADNSVNKASIKSSSDAKFGVLSPFSVYVNFKNVILPEQKYINLMLN